MLTDPTVAVCYPPGGRFHREAFSPGGDDYVFEVLDPELLEEIGPEPFRALPASTFLRPHVLDDPLEFEELIVGLPGVPLPRAGRWREPVKEVLAARLGDK